MQNLVDVEKLGARCGHDVVHVENGKAKVGVINYYAQGKKDYLFKIKGEILKNYLFRDGTFQVILFSPENHSGVAILYLNGSEGAWKVLCSGDDFDKETLEAECEDITPDQISEITEIVSSLGLLDYKTLTKC
jgi:hypothetical protein